MPEPEIARRCHSCGASIRDLAFFCPECGKELKTSGELDRPSESTAPIESGITSPLVEPKEQKDQLETNRPAGLPQEMKPGAANPAKETPRAPAVGDGRGRVQRATGLAKSVGGDVVQRGHKLREMSSVVLDEAHYDPSLRFVLVAAALFILFLVIMLLNKFIV